MANNVHKQSNIAKSGNKDGSVNSKHASNASRVIRTRGSSNPCVVCARIGVFMNLTEVFFLFIYINILL